MNANSAVVFLIIRSAIARPKPKPPDARSRLVSILENASKIFFRSSCGMPTVQNSVASAKLFSVKYSTTKADSRKSSSTNKMEACESAVVNGVLVMTLLCLLGIRLVYCCFVMKT